MKNIYEDEHDIHGNEAAEVEPQKLREDESPAELARRRQYRSAEERRAKREQRLESTAARRAQKDAAMKARREQHDESQLVYSDRAVPEDADGDSLLPQTQPDLVPVTPQYYIQQEPGKPPQLFVSKHAGASQPTVSSNGAVYRTADSKKPPVTGAPNTAGMKIVYQSPDFDTPTDRETGSGSDFPYQRETARPKIQKPEYSRGDSFEKSIIDAGRHPVYNAESFSARQETSRAASRRQSAAERRVEELPLESVKRTVSMKAADVREPQPETPEKKPKKSDESRDATYDKIRKVVLVVALAVVLGSLIYLAYEWKLSRDSRALENELSALAPIEAVSGDEEEEPATETTLSPEEMFAKLRSEHPNINYPEGLQAKYAEYYTINQDFAGYLSIPGLDIGMPVVQCDNDSDYLKKNFYKKSTKYGAPFVTHVNNLEPLDKNTVIFGHNMKNGTVFAPLLKYQTLEGYKSAPVITFNTLYKDYQWKVIAAILTNAYPKDDNGYVFLYYYTTIGDAAFESYLQALSVRSIYSTGVDVLPTDKLLTLSTCAYDFDDARFVVIARLVRTGESAEVDTSKAQLNANPRYPQAYYDKKKLSNPYDDTYNWTYS